MRRVARDSITALLIAGCSGRETTGVASPSADTGQLGSFVVSTWHGLEAAAGGGSTTSSPASSGVVYVSLPPGSIAGATAVTIRVRSTGASTSTAAVDGGFDPVAIIADPNDTLDVAVSTTNSGSPTTFVLPVPKHGRPVVIRTAPPAGKRDVPLNTNVAVVFSEPIAPNSANSATIQLAAGTSAVAGVVAFADTSRLTTTFAPSKSLALSTDYTLTVTTTVEDDDGQALAAPVVVTFTTTSDPDPLAHVSIDQPHGIGEFVYLGIGEQAPLTVTVTDSGYLASLGFTPKWSSDSVGIAAVSPAGVVTGLRLGDAMVTVSDAGKTDSIAIRVVRTAFSAFQLSVHAFDDAGLPVSGATVEEEYYGARPPTCYDCVVPYGWIVNGTTDPTGVFAGQFSADPEVMDGFTCLNTPQTFAYVIVRDLPAHETDRRYIKGSPPTVMLTSHLHALTQLTPGDTTVSLSITADDPLYADLSTSPGSCMGYVSRTVRVHAETAGVLTVSARSTTPGAATPAVEIDRADETDSFAVGTGSATLNVRAGDIFQVQISTHIDPGGPSQSLVIRAVIVPGG